MHTTRLFTIFPGCLPSCGRGGGIQGDGGGVGVCGGGGQGEGIDIPSPDQDLQPPGPEHLPLWPWDLSHDAFGVTSPPPWTEWVTHTCENITFDCFATQAVIKEFYSRMVCFSAERFWKKLNGSIS